MKNVTSLSYPLRCHTMCLSDLIKPFHRQWRRQDFQSGGGGASGGQADNFFFFLGGGGQTFCKRTNACMKIHVIKRG